VIEVLNWLVAEWYHAPIVILIVAVFRPVRTGGQL
jgi:hypothetical protein